MRAEELLYLPNAVLAQPDQERGRQMGRKRFTAEQIIIKLREAEVELAKGQPPAEVCRKLGGDEQTLLPLAEGVWRTPSELGQAFEMA